MELLPLTKIESLKSSSGNNICLECDSTEVEWVSFPSSIFLCRKCAKLHRDYKPKQTLKSLLVSDFSSHEITKMNLGGNDRFLSLMKEYKIPIKQTPYEYKYSTRIVLYYNKLLETQVNKIERNPGADEEYDKIVNARPSHDSGALLIEIDDNNNTNNNNNTKNNKQNNESWVGGWLGYFGEKISGFNEYVGIKGAIDKTTGVIGGAMENYGVKDKFNSMVGYAKSAGGYVFNKTQEISNNPIVHDTKEKISHTMTNIKDSTTSLLNNINLTRNDNNYNSHYSSYNQI